MKLRELWEDAKAWRRGERRVAPHGTRGRVYRRKKGDVPAGPMPGTATGTATMTAKIVRADGTVEDLGRLI